jgi:hypothetical protein
MEEQPHGNAPLRNARQGAAARGIHDLQALADGELTPRGSPGAGLRPPLARPDQPAGDPVSDPSTGSGSRPQGVHTHPPRISGRFALPAGRDARRPGDLGGQEHRDAGEAEATRAGRAPSRWCCASIKSADRPLNASWFNHKVWARIVRAAALRRLRVHDTRHT